VNIFSPQVSLLLVLTFPVGVHPAGAFSLLDVLAPIALVSAAIPALLFAINVWLFVRPGRPWNKRVLPPVSVLIPARNEEGTIAAAIESVLASRGVEFEIVVLDDDSTDRTAEIVQAIADEDLRVRLERAPELPEGWNGKQHACWQLASLATHDVFCFLDADVRLGPEALYRTLSELNYVAPGAVERVLVSGFPRQETRTFLEWLLLPLVHFVLLGFLPLPGERWSGRKEFAAGCGQLMMVRREAYFATEGHSAIRASMHDGLLLPRLLRRGGFKTSVFDLSRDAVCRMYLGAGEVWRGLAKNATEGMASWSGILIFTVLLMAGQVLPLALAVWAAVRQNQTALRVALLALVAGYAVRGLVAWRYRQSWRGVLLHPMGVLVLVVLQWYALARKVFRGRVTWKGRVYRAG
jgi:hypothetical protein